METPQNKFIEKVYEKANEIDATFVLANAALDFYPIIYCSQGFFGDVGWTRNEVTTKDVYLNFMMGKRTDKKCIRTYEKGILNKEFTQVEMILYSKGGTKRWFLVTLLPVKDTEENISIFIVFFNYMSHYHDPIPDSPKRLWKIVTRGALNKPSLEFFRKSIDRKKDAERKKKHDRNNIKTRINNMFIPIYGLTKLQVPRFLIRHSHIMKSIWDSFILICILYTSAMVPFMVAFHMKNDQIVIFDTIVDFMFLIDIVLTFFTTYVDNGEIITNTKKIRYKYLKGWFALDCVAALPYSVVNFLLNNPRSLEVLSALKILRLIRLGKVSKKIGRYMQMSAVTLGIWLLLFLLCGHWMACVWYMIAYFWDEPGKKHHSWLYILAEVTDQPYNFTTEGKIVDGTGPDLFTLYFSALYYTMSSLTTCGFGNIAPNTAAEKLFGCITMLLGCVLYALIFGQVTNIISQLQKSSNEFTDQIASIHNFNKIYKMPPKVAKRLEDFFIATWAVTKGTDEQEILKPCPRDLQSDLCINIHKTVFENNSAFRHLSDPALRALSRYFWTIRTAPGDKLITTGEEVNTVYFVANGSLEVYSGNDLTGLIGPDDSFGKRLTDDHITFSVYDVRACSYGAIHCIMCDSVKEALSLYPEENDKIKYDLQLAFDITRQLETVTKSGEVISTELSFKDKDKEMQQRGGINKGQSFSESMFINEGGAVDYSESGRFSAESKANQRNHLDVLSGMSELKGELRRETERMNAKMGIVEAQMRLVLKLLRRKNKINDIDPEIGMQLDELMQYDEQEGGEEEDTEWFVADAHGWKEEPSRGGSSSGSRGSSKRSVATTSSHRKVMAVSSSPPKLHHMKNVAKVISSVAKKPQPTGSTATPVKPKTIISTPKPPPKSEMKKSEETVPETGVVPPKKPPVPSKPALKKKESVKGQLNETFEEDMETILL